MDITFVGSRPAGPRPPVTLTVSRPAVLVDIHPDPALADTWVPLAAPSTAIQTRPAQSEHSTSTEMAPLVTSDVRALPSEEEDQALVRMRRKIERSDAFNETVDALADVLEPLVALNNVYNITSCHFSTGTVRADTPAPSVAVSMLLRDPVRDAARWAASLSWGDGNVLAVAYGSHDFAQALLDLTPGPAVSRSSFVWDVATGRVVHELKPPGSPLTAVIYADKEPHLLVAGTYNGLVCAFDTRSSASRPKMVTPRGAAHRDPITSIVSAKAKSGTEFLVASVDGVVRTWDTKDLSTPLDDIIVHSGAGGAAAGGALDDSEMRHGVISLAYDPQAGVTRFLAGTEQGMVVSVNRKGQNALDRILGVQPAHEGPVSALTRSPFMSRCTLSAGGWTARLWHDDVKNTALLTSSFARARFTAAAWSPVRPGVFVLADAAGSLHFWDLASSLTGPALVSNVSDAPLCAVAFAPDGASLACGGADGAVTIVSLSDYFAVPRPDEKALVAAVVDREVHRSKNLTMLAVAQSAAESVPAPAPLPASEVTAVAAEVLALWGVEEGGATEEQLLE